MKSKSQVPLLTVGGKVKAEVHKAKFRAFATTRYLDIEALKKAKKAVIEIGSVEASGVTATIAAEIRNGAITRIKPVACQSCAKREAEAKGSKAELKKVVLEALKRVRDSGQRLVKMPIAIMSARSFDIPIGPIIITIGWPPDICIVVQEPDGEICWYCLTTPDGCVGPIIVQ